MEENFNLVEDEDIEVVRIGWCEHAKRIDICLIKTSNEPWSHEQCFKMMYHLENDATFTVPLRFHSNSNIFKELISMEFRISTSNARYFDAIDEFIRIINRYSSRAVLAAENIKEDLGKSSTLWKMLQNDIWTSFKL